MAACDSFFNDYIRYGREGCPGQKSVKKWL